MNNGFSAPVNYWGTIDGLTPKSSNDGKTSSVAEAPNEYGDTAAHDVYGEVLAPSTEYAVTGDVKNVTNGTLSVSSLGKGNMRVYVCCATGFAGIDGQIGGTSKYLK